MKIFAVKSESNNHKNRGKAIETKNPHHILVIQNLSYNSRTKYHYVHHNAMAAHEVGQRRKVAAASTTGNR